MEKFKFVVVDDAIFMRSLLKRMLEEVDEYSVVGEGKNGYEAIELAKQHLPDVMTLDITMPEMDGLTAVKEILKISPKTRVIMVSAMGQQGIVVDTIKSGARDFIIKPFDRDRVLQSIKNVLDASK